MTSRSRPPSGEFRYTLPLDVRFADTDALGHVNNATYLSYFEAARAGYYRQVTGEPFGFGEGPRRWTFLVAQACVDYRAPAFFGETLDVACRVAWRSRSSFGLEYRITAEASPVAAARLIADGSTVQVMFDLDAKRVTRVPPDFLELIERHEGRPIPLRDRSTGA